MNKNLFTKSFYKSNLNRAINEAGPRYTPGLEKGAPNLEIQELDFAFEILGRTQKFYKYLLSLAEELEKESHLKFSITKIIELKIGISNNRLQRLRRYIENLGTLVNATSKTRDLNENIACKDIRLAAWKCLNTIGDVDSALYREYRNTEKPKDKDKTETTNHLIYTFRKLGEIIHRIKDFCDRPRKLPHYVDSFKVEFPALF